MKKLYLIGGPMGVGKTATGRLLKQKLPRAVLLDGDNCWDADPFVVTDETKRMVVGNIAYLLNSFLACSAYDNIVFVWVMHEQSIIDDILSRVDCSGCETVAVSLVCDAPALAARLARDIEVGGRQPDIVRRSVERLPCYRLLDTERIDTTALTAEEVADLIISRFQRPCPIGRGR